MDKAIQLYKSILSEVETSFPLGYWKNDTSFHNAKTIFKYLIDEILQVDINNPEDIKAKISKSTFEKYKLKTPLNRLFSNSPYKVFNAVYPNVISHEQFYSKVFEADKNHSIKWNIDLARKSIIDLIENKLKWNKEDIENKLSYNTLRNNGLRQVLKQHYRESPYLAIKDVYPNENWDKLRSKYKSK
jgi:hypothetical protein